MASSNNNATVLLFDEFRVDPKSRVLLHNGESVSLTPRVFDTLLAFVQRPGETISKDELMAAIWPDSFVEESNLTQNVAVLRKALGDDSKQPRYIVTIPGHGYRFVAEVSEDRVGDTNGFVKEPDERLGGQPRRGRPLMWLAVLGILAIVSLGVVLYFTKFANWRSEMPVVDRTVQVTAWSGLDFFPTIAPDGNTIAYSSDRTGSFEIYIKQLVASAREVQLTSDGGQNFQPDFSPDGSLIAYHSKSRGGIWIVPTSGGTARQVADFGCAPSWSPDGSRIAFQSDPLTDLGSGARNAMPPSTIWIVPASGGTPVQLTRPGEPPGGHGKPSWSPVGRTIVFDTSDWNSSVLVIVNVESGEVRPLKAGDHQASDAIFTADGRALLFIADTGLSVQVLPLSSSGTAAAPPEKLFDVSGARVRQISLDGKGKRLVYASLTTSSNLWSTDPRPGSGGEPQPLTRHSSSRTALPAFSPDGNKVVYQSFTTGGISHLWTMDPDGGQQTQISSQSAFSSTWIANGSRIYFVRPDSGGVTSLWYITPDGGVEKKVLDFDEEAYTVRVSPDEKTVVIASKRSGAMNLWSKPLDGSELRQITFDQEFAGFPTFSKDGKWLTLQLKRGESTYIAVMPASGGDIVQLPSPKGQAWPYDWAPDNDRIVFAGQRDGVWNIYSISRTTGEERRLTNFTVLNSFVRYPAWSPRDDKVVYEYALTTGNVWTVDFK